MKDRVEMPICEHKDNYECQQYKEKNGKCIYDNFDKHKINDPDCRYDVIRYKKR